MIATKTILFAVLLLLVGEICGEDIMFSFSNPSVLLAPIQGTLDLRNPQNGGCITIRNPLVRRTRNRSNMVNLNCVVVFDDLNCGGARRTLDTATSASTPANRRRNTLTFEPLSFRLCPEGTEARRDRDRPRLRQTDDDDDDFQPPRSNAPRNFNRNAFSPIYGAPSSIPSFFNF